MHEMSGCSTHRLALGEQPDFIAHAGAAHVRHAQAGAPEARAAYLEELIVRRELAINHVWWSPDYDRYEGLPAWARATLEAAASDPRPHLYDYEAFDAAATHDPYWNAAMTEMKVTGYMHNRLRMYWGKKILQWSATPQEAFATVLALNNRYLLDGRDANFGDGRARVNGPEIRDENGNLIDPE